MVQRIYKEDIYLLVRQAVMVEGISIRGASREFGLHRDTVRKMLVAYRAGFESGNSRLRKTDPCYFL